MNSTSELIRNGSPTAMTRRLAFLLDALPGPVYYIDRECRYQYANQRYLEWFGAASNCIGLHLREVAGEQAFQALEPHIERAFKGEHVVFDLTMPFRPDLVRDVHVEYVPDFAPDGSISGFAAMITDITERNKTDEAQRALDRQLTLLIEASGKLLGSPESAEVRENVLDLACQVISADAYAVWQRDEHRSSVWRIATMRGLSERYPSTLVDSGFASQLAGGPFVIEDVYQPAYLSSRADAYRDEGLRSMLVVQLTSGTDIRETLVFYYRTRHEFTKIELRIASALANLASAAIATADLYAKQSELRKLAESERTKAQFIAKAGEILSSSLDFDITLAAVVDLAVPAIADWAAIDTLDEGGYLRRVAVKHTDPKRIELAKEFHRRFPPQEGDAAYTAVHTGKSILVPELTRELLVTGVQDPGKLSILLELGLRSFMMVPLTVGGRTFGLITLVTAESGRIYDATDLAFAEELARRAAIAMDHARLFSESEAAQAALRQSNTELRRANDDLNQFAYSASHDLQEPLRILALYSQLLQRRYENLVDAQGRQYLDFIIEAANRMESLLQDLLAFIQAMGATPAQPSPIEAASVLRKALKNLAPSIEDAGADISFFDLPNLRIEEIHLLQIFQNLISNAIKYRSAAPLRVLVTAERCGTDWKISVRDNGIGVPPEYRTHIFGLFKRLHPRQKYPGTGIGLAICQRIVERYGGRIWVEAEPGGGSNFTFALPAI